MKITLKQLRKIIRETAANLPNLTLPNTSGWESVAHHATMLFGKQTNSPDYEEFINQPFLISINSLDFNDKVMAVSVDSDFPLIGNKPNPHITIAVNRPNGGKPAMSGELQWTKGIDVGGLQLESYYMDYNNGSPYKAGYAGLILTKNSHMRLIDAVNQALDSLHPQDDPRGGLPLPYNPGQNPGFAEPNNIKMESVLRKKIAMIIREELKRI
jgi:hypothetical protein